MKKIVLVSMAALMLTACGPQSKDVSVDKPVASLSCSANFTAYKLADLPVQFCYNKAWGEPVVTKLKGEVGSSETVTFGTADNAKAPKLWLATKDFKSANSADKVVDFKFINATIGDEQILKKQIKDAAGYDEKDVVARKTDVSAVRAIRADVGGKVKQIVYFVGDAFEGYNMVVSGSKDIAEEVDSFAFDIAL